MFVPLGGDGLLLMPRLNTAAAIGAAIGPVTTLTADAAGEYSAVIGHLVLASGPGTSKVLSAAGGGAIHWLTGATVTFSNGSTTLRVGLQGVSSAGAPNGTWGAYAAHVGGVDSLSADTVKASVMTSGSSTLSYGQLVAIVVYMESRGGSDRVDVAQSGDYFQIPYGYASTGGSPGKLRRPGVLATIVCDDGTLGWILFGNAVNAGVASSLISSSTTPDEAALVFRLPCAARVSALVSTIRSMSSGRDFELILYASPRGSTPVVLEAITIDGDLSAAISSGTHTLLVLPTARVHTLNANTWYAVALRPTTTSTAGFAVYAASAASLSVPAVLGGAWSLGTRTNQTGPFAVDAAQVPLMGALVSALDVRISTARTRMVRG